MIHLDYRDVRPIYAQITDGFREQILSGVLMPGDRLPSVRELAAELAINPNTIQRSYRQLELENWISSVPGKGSFVCETPDSALRQREELLAEFDQTAAALTAMGVSAPELIRRLEKGGKSS